MPRTRDVERALQAWRAAERAVDAAMGPADRTAAEAEARRLQALYRQLVDDVAGAGATDDVAGHDNGWRPPRTGDGG